MKSIELLPTKENIFNTLIDDPFGRDEEIASFLNLLITIEGHFVISIDGKWGTGKTFFIKQCELILNTINDTNKLTTENKEKILHLPFLSKESLLGKLKGQNCVYFDAWANDDYEKPILAILNTLISKCSFGKTMPSVDLTQVENLIEEMGNKFFTNKLGISVKPILETLKRPGSKEAEDQKSLHDYIEKIINNLTPDGNRLIIFIDELDRCKPSFAVKLLEQIKHYFLLNNVTFVFTTNILELSETISKFYGNNFRGDKYLTRFFDLSLKLSLIDPQQYYSYLSSKDSSYIYEKNKLAVIKFFNMSMRSVGKFVVSNELIDYHSLEGNNEFRLFNEAEAQIAIDIEWMIIPFLFGLRIENKKEENLFLTGQNEITLQQYVLTLESFWNFFKYTGIQQSLKTLCDINKEEKIEENKKLIIKRIYNQLFVSPISRNQVASDKDRFWYVVRQQIENTLNIS